MVLSIVSISSRLLLTNAVSVCNLSRKPRCLRRLVTSAFPSSTPMILLLVIFLVFVGELEAVNNPKLYQGLPARISYYKHKGLLLNCTIGDHTYRNSLSKDSHNGGAAGKENSVIGWYKVSDKGEGLELKPGNERYKISENGRQLTIRSIEGVKLLKDIKGGYYCEAKEKSGKTRSRTCVVNPVQNENINIIPDSVSTYIGGTAVLACKISPGYAHIHYYVVGWLIVYNGKSELIKHSTDKYSVVKGIYPSELHIRQTSESDKEKGYQCVLRSKIWHNSAEVRSRAMTLSINKKGASLAKPMLQSSHHHLTIDATDGSTVELPCVFYISTSSPGRYRYIWKHGKQQIYPLTKSFQTQWKDKYRIVANNHGNILIKNVNENDAGSYLCSLQNDDSKELIGGSTIKLSIKSPLNVKIIPPRQVVDFKMKTNFTCQVFGYPHTKVYWLKDGELLRPSRNVIFSEDNKVLTILVARREDIGVYQCFVRLGSATSPEDNAQARSFLEVQKMPPTLVNQYPVPDHGRTSGYTKLNRKIESIRLRCDFAGSPVMSITWYRDDERISLKHKAYTLYDPPWKELSIDIKHFRDKGLDAIMETGGMYTAVAKNDYGQAQCKSYVEIDMEMTIRDFKANQRAIEGRDFRLKCYVIGNGAFKDLKISWTKKDQLGVEKNSLPNNHRHNIEENGRILVIKNVKKEEDDGTYECTAKNARGTIVSKSTRLDVSRLPIINYFKKIHHLNEGVDQVTITCNVKNQANKPWYAWWTYEGPSSRDKLQLKNKMVKPGVRITYNKDHNKFHTGESTVQGVPGFVPANTWVMLQIERPRRDMHTGNYTCTIKNNVGESNASAVVTFKQKIKFDKKPPAEKKVIMSQDLSLDCTAKGVKHQPEIVWKYYNKERRSYLSVLTLKSKTISQLSNGTLLVKNINKSDPTRYMCYISLDGSEAEAISQVVKVTVFYPAQIAPIANEERRVGQSFNMTCELEGDGNIEAEWLFYNEHSKEFEEIEVPCIGDTVSATQYKTLPCDGFPGRPNEMLSDIYRAKLRDTKANKIIYRLSFSSVRSTHPKLYKCKARNQYNKDGSWAEREVRLTVIDRPSQPQELSSNQVTARSITLTWAPPISDGNKPIQYYCVTYYRNRDSEIVRGTKKTFNVTSKADKRRYSTLIENLHPAYEYRLEVQAVNGVGTSKVAQRTQRTQEAKPSGPVRNISANGTNSNTIRVSWLEPAPDKVNGLITAYSVCLLATGSKPLSTPYKDLPWRTQGICRVIDTGHLKAEFNSLPKFTKYIVRVYARNSAGDSPPDFTSARTLEDVPQGPPVEVTCTPGETDVKLQWNPPQHDKMNGILTGYNVRYFVTNDYEDESNFSKNLTSRTTAVVTNLLKFTNYTFRINAVNSKGSGPPSQDITCLTKPSQPDPPKEFKVFPVNASCLVVSWKHPVHSNGILTNYEIELFKGDDLVNNFNVKANTSIHFNYKYMCDLDFFTYEVRVRAKNHAPFLSEWTDKKSASPTNEAPARILAFNQSVTTINDVDLKLYCNYVPTNTLYGGDAVTQSWKKQSGKTSERRSDGPILTLRAVQQDSKGAYTCDVTNLYGKDSVTYEVVVHAPPNPPLLSHGRQGLRSLEVEWVPTGSSTKRAKGVPISGYLLWYKILGPIPEEKAVSLQASNRTYFLSNLNCATIVEFRIRAKNKVGYSDDSNVVKMRTQGSIPIPGDADKLYKKDSSKTNIYINLSAVFGPGDGCYPLVYRIWLAPMSEKPTSRKPTVIKHENLSNQCCYNMTNLNAGSHFNYVIEARNAAGGVNISGQMYTLNVDGTVPQMQRNHDKTTKSFWKQPHFLIGIIFGFLIIFCVVLGLVLLWRRRQLSSQMRENEKGPVRCINNLKNDEGKSEGGLPQPFGPSIPSSVPPSRVRPPVHEEDGFSDDGSVDSDGNINPYATFATYESNTLDRHEHTDGVPKELGAVCFASGQMRERMQPHPRSARKRAAYYEAHGLTPKQYENESVPGTLGPKRRSNSMEDIDSAAYNRGYATGGGGQMGRSYYDSKYTDGMPYRGSSVISSTTMSSNHDELSQAYEYGRRARIESGLNTHDVEDTLDLHTGSGSSETTDPGIRQFTQQPPMPDEQRQATCEVPLIHNQRRTSLNPSETYEAVDEAYYKRGVQRQPMAYPARHAPLPELPNLSTTTLGRPRMTAAGIKAGQFRNRSDSDSVYGGQGHVYDSTDSYYSYTPSNFGRRPVGPGGNAGDFPRQRNAPAPSRYYNGPGGPNAAAERRPLVGATAAPVASSRALPYGAHAIPGADPEESRSLLMNNRRYSGSRTRDSGVGTSGGDSSGSIPPLSSRRPVRPTVSTARPDGPPVIQAPRPRPENSDSENENIYTSEFTVV